MVLAIKDQWPSNGSLSDAVIQLAVLASAGATVYFATVIGLWLLAGRPPETERHMLNLAGAWIQARRSPRSIA